MDLPPLACQGERGPVTPLPAKMDWHHLPQIQEICTPCKQLSSGVARKGFFPAMLCIWVLCKLTEL